jgi:hypothetical protein
MSEPVQIQSWAGGWYLVGNGPSYLLFCPNKEVMHLASGLHRALRRDLQGYDAIDTGDKLKPLAWALAVASSGAIYDLDSFADTAKRKWAAYVVVREIEELVSLFQQNRQIFEGRLRRLATLIKAAGIFEMYHGPPEAPGAPSLPSPPGSFFARDRYGQRLLLVSNPHFVFRCEPHSPIAGCAQKVWHQEQAQWGDRTVLYSVPTRRDLRDYLEKDEATVNKACRAEGCDWLGRAPAGRHRRRWRHPVPSREPSERAMARSSAWKYLAPK